MRVWLLTVLITSVALAGCAESSEPVETVDTVEELTLSVPVAVTAEAEDAWIGEFSADGATIAAFSFTLPNKTISYFDDPRVGLEIQRVLPGASLEHGFLQILDSEGNSLYHTVNEPLTVRFRSGIGSLPGGASFGLENAPSHAFLPADMAGEEVTVVVGIDAGTGDAGLAIRRMAYEDDRADDEDAFFDRLNGTAARLELAALGSGFANHIYLDQNIALGIINFGLEMWTSGSSFTETVPADLRPAVAVRVMEFSGSFDGSGRSVLSLTHGGSAGAGTFALDGDLHGTTIAESGTLLGGAIPQQRHEGSGDGGASATLTVRGASATTLAEVMIFQLIGRGLSTEQIVEPQGNATVNAEGEIVTPTGIILAGSDEILARLG